MTSAFDWKGRVGDVWAEEWPRTDRSFAGLAVQLDAAILAVAPVAGKAYDIGCGAGATSIALATARPRLAVTGIDLSATLVAIAAERAKRLANADFRVADAGDLPPASADLLVSRHGVMFFDDPVAGFSALRRATRGGGSLVFSCFRPRENNEWSLVIDAAVENDNFPATGYVHGPYSLADPGFTADILHRAGWRDARPQAIDFTYVGGGGDDPVADALSFFSRIGSAARVLAEAPPDRRDRIRARLRAALAGHVHDGAVTFAAGAWIWTATAGGEEPA